MKPTDLRLGSIVKLRDTGEIARVCGGDYNFVMCGLKWGRYTKDYDEIEGVLIFDHWQDIERGVIEWDDKSEDETMYFYTPLGYNHRFRYIHELQNIHHALTGEELKIGL